MDIVENDLTVELDEFLNRRLFCFLAQRSDDGPRVSPLWFLWRDDGIWNIAQLADRSYPDRVAEYPQTAIAIVDFDPATGRVEHVGMRGRATLEPYDEERAACLLRKYLGDNTDQWPERFVDLDPTQYRLLRFDPDTIVARDQSYPRPSNVDA